MNREKTENTKNLTPKRRILFSLIALLLSLIILELGFRVLLAFHVGPSVLLYGTPFDRAKISTSSQISETEPEAKNFINNMTMDEWRKRRTVVTHPNSLQGYSKYYPNQKRVDFDVETGERFDVTINNHGFRGRDFSDKKKPGVLRIICLGASSTFGYFDRDNETYPFYLEQILNKKYDGRKKFEVINLGIPHLDSTEIYNLFVTEGVQLQPDVVTFYEGNNDTEPPPQWLRKTFIHHVIKKFGQYLITAKFIDSLLDKYVKVLSPSLSDKAVSVISKNFIDNVSKIDQECRKRGILFVVANQQKNSQSFDRAMLKKLTYQQEVEKIKAKSRQTGALTHPELQLLIHSVLMEKLQAWVKVNQVPFVDVIGKLDHDRDVLVSWVHLSPRGNHMVAEALAEKILEYNWESQDAGF